MTEQPRPSTALSDMFAAIGDRAGDTVAQLFDRLTAAGVPAAEAARALGIRLTAANVDALATGDGMAAAQLRAWGAWDVSRPPPAGTDAHWTNRPRLERAALTILERTDLADVAALDVGRRAVHRLGRSEAVEAAQHTYSEQMTRSPVVSGWTRQLEADACELCVWWARDGRVWHKNHSMPTHKGCTCAQAFTTIDRSQFRNVTTRAYHQSEERKEAGTLDERRQMMEGDYSRTSGRVSR